MDTWPAGKTAAKSKFHDLMIQIESNRTLLKMAIYPKINPKFAGLSTIDFLPEVQLSIFMTFIQIVFEYMHPIESGN